MKFNKLIPELVVSNLSKSLGFYVNFQGIQVMLSENDTWNNGKLEYPFGRGINFQIEVKDINPIIKSLESNNYPLFRIPKENWYRKDKQLLGNREFLVQDTDDIC